MDLLDDRAQKDLETSHEQFLFAKRHPQFFSRVARGIKCLLAEPGEGLRYVMLTEYGLRDPEGHISNISGKYDAVLNRFYLYKVDGELCPIFDARLAQWTVNERFDAGIGKLCGLLEHYIFTARQEHDHTNQNGSETR